MMSHMLQMTEPSLKLSTAYSPATYVAKNYINNTYGNEQKKLTFRIRNYAVLW